MEIRSHLQRQCKSTTRFEPIALYDTLSSTPTASRSNTSERFTFFLNIHFKTKFISRRWYNTAQRLRIRWFDINIKSYEWNRMLFQRMVILFHQELSLLI